MYCRVIAVAVAAVLALAGSIRAQTTSGAGDQSKKPPQDKSSQPSSSQTPNIEVRDGVLWIGPKKLEPPKTPAPPGRGGHMSPPGDLQRALAFAKAAAGAFLRDHQLDSPRINGEFPLMRTGMNASSFPGPRDFGSAPTPSERLIVAQQQAPVVKYNRYVIQFKSNVTAQQRNALLSKYGLVVRREMANLNIVVVERSAPGDEPQPKNLAEIFNPPIIQNLRREPIVANATVDSAASPRVIPKASDTKFTADDGAVHRWSWTINPPPATSVTDLVAANRPQTPDGNWGLKAIRMPPVWTIVQNYRAAKRNAVRPKLGLIDTGFAKHTDLSMNLLPSPNVETQDGSMATASVGIPCERAHGNHIAGVVAGTFGNGIGVDGAIPDANVDAVPVTDILVDESAVDISRDRTPERLGQQLSLRFAYFSLVLQAVQSYVVTEDAKNSGLRVVNISMGFNIGKLIELGWDADEVKNAVKAMLQAQAQMVAGAVIKYEDSILFVVAAGNDSEYSPTPHEAKWGSPLAWLAKGELQPIYRRPKNILVVEAVDRTGQRAIFSNVAGHVAAPGVDILSTLSDGDTPYFLCHGTSQAAPHAAAVATLMFELSPTKKPAEIIDIMIKSATPRSTGSFGAPRLDALEAVLRLSPYNDSRNEQLLRLTDLNGDGKVDVLDMREFARRLAVINDNQMNGTPFTEDLNGDKVTDGNECHWPAFDFNGSGAGSLSQADARRVLGEYRNDLAIMQLAWTDKTKSAATAIKETGLDAALLAADMRNPRVSPQACR
jgi:hypothetical protein